MMDVLFAGKGTEELLVIFYSLMIPTWCAFTIFILFTGKNRNDKIISLVSIAILTPFVTSVILGSYSIHILKLLVVMVLLRVFTEMLGSIIMRIAMYNKVFEWQKYAVKQEGVRPEKIKDIHVAVGEMCLDITYPMGELIELYDDLKEFNKELKLKNHK